MKIKQIVFGSQAFRMLSNMKLEIADRITVIAGHNGIGKSTILGLIANGSEIKKNQGTTLFSLAFQAQFHELFVLDEEKDYFPQRNTKPSFQLIYQQDGLEDLIKTCSVSKHNDKEIIGDKTVIKSRLKILPRGSQEGWDVGDSAKVNIPTLYLSMSRMLPIGDQQNSLNSSLYNKISDTDKGYIESKFKQIIDNKLIDNGTATKHELKGTTKKSILPQFEHSTKTISLGQDSLSSIITAFASFNKLKREHPDTYKGGILLIDEIDAGFHPKAQMKLIQLIKNEAKNLQLQVIMTTHSLTVIKEVLKISDETARSGRNVDSVIYIEDVMSPKLMRIPTYQHIKNDMLSILPHPHEELPKTKIYFEDEEAKWFCEQILIIENINLTELFRREFIWVAAKLGCDNLKALFKVDDYFSNVVIIFDNDILSSSIDKILIDEHSNLIVLPVHVDEENCEPNKRTPEYQLYNIIYTLLNDKKNVFWNDLPSGYHMSSLKENFIDTFPIVESGNKKLRDLRKEWFIINKPHFEKLKLIKQFCINYPTETNQFINDLKSAINAVIK